MIRPKLSPGGYRNLLRMSQRSHLLVEGQSDKRLFALLLNEFATGAPAQGPRHGIDIDSAEDLVGFQDGLGNRQKVEEICASVENAPYAERFVGFVDREFRGFEIGSTLGDDVGAHRVLGRLVWSRGHSAENYFFDFATLRDPLRDFSVTEHFDGALDRLETVLEATIRLACAASLAGRECNLLWVVPKVDWQIVEVSPPAVSLAVAAWQESLVQRQNLTSSQADELAVRVEAWHRVTSTSAYPVVRWMCHGHAGLAFTWAVYTRCVFDVCDDPDARAREAQAKRVLKAEESVRFNACASRWARRALGNECDYPMEVLELLGVGVA